METMERPNENDLMPNHNWQGTKKKYTKKTYLEALEKYIDYLENMLHDKI